MTPPRNMNLRSTGKSASPAQRSAEFTAVQQRLKPEAADRRLEAADKPAVPPRAARKIRGRA
jgi:hypothetical protein